MAEYELLTNGIGHTEFKDSELGRIPKSWEVKKASEIGTFKRGKGISKVDLHKSGVPAVRYADIYTTHGFTIRHFDTFISPKKTSETFKIKKGNILFASSGETHEEIGKSTAFVDDFEAYAGGDIIVFSPDMALESTFLSSQLNTGKARKKISQLSQGSSVIHIYANQIKDVQLLIPPLLEQKKIASILTSVEDNIEEKQRKLEHTQSLKKSLMQDLLTGKVRVQVD